MKISQVEWGTVSKAAIKEYSEDDVPGLAAEMAYWIVFSIFPFFAFLATLLGIAGRFVGTQELRNTISTEVLGPLPPATRTQIEAPLTALLESGSGGALSFTAIFTALFALNTASTAVLTMMKAFNRAYGVEETRNFIMQRLTAIGLTFVLMLLLVGSTLFLSLGGALANLLDIGLLGTVLLFIARLAAAVLGISLGLAILYWKGPNVEQQFQWISPGAIIATLALIVFSGLFSLYVNLIGGSSANKTYGALAGVILFLLFLRLASTIILLGAEFNAEAAKRYDPETIRDKVTDPRKQLPGQQPAPHPEAAAEAGVSTGQVAETNSRSAEKLAAGGGGVAAATLTTQAQGDGGADDGAAAGVGGRQVRPTYRLEDFDDPSVEERLRALRARPYTSAMERARTEQATLPGPERARRARTTVAAFAVSAATAVGGVLVGALRRAGS